MNDQLGDENFGDNFCSRDIFNRLHRIPMQDFLAVIFSMKWNWEVNSKVKMDSSVTVQESKYDD